MAILSAKEQDNMVDISTRTYFREYVVLILEGLRT